MRFAEVLGQEGISSYSNLQLVEATSLIGNPIFFWECSERKIPGFFVGITREGNKSYLSSWEFQSFKVSSVQKPNTEVDSIGKHNESVVLLSSFSKNE